MPFILSFQYVNIFQINALDPTAKPAITSPCPFKNLVPECNTTSAPSLMVFVYKGSPY